MGKVELSRILTRNGRCEKCPQRIHTRRGFCMQIDAEELVRIILTSPTWVRFYVELWLTHVPVCH